MEDVAVYGYMTPLKMKIILALALADGVVRDADIVMIFKAFHTAYARSVANPFLKLHASPDMLDPSALMTANDAIRWTGFRKRVDEIAKAVTGVDGQSE